jgi:hypothetical protein
VLPLTVWVTHSDSVPPMFEYWFCAMARTASVSRLLPPWDGTVFGGLAHWVAAVGMSGPVNVDVEILFQSTWNL